LREEKSLTERALRTQSTLRRVKKEHGSEGGLYKGLEIQEGGDE